MASALEDYITTVTHKAVCSNGSYVFAELRLSMFLRYIIGGGKMEDITHIHGVHNITFYKVVWHVVEFVNIAIISLSSPWLMIITY